jgi:hypothetical protein
MYEGRPVLVKAIISLTKVRITYVGEEQKWTDIFISDEKFQTFPFELGFLNMKDNGVGFLSRSGIRNSNYGLALNHIVVDSFDSPFGVDMSTSRVWMLNCLMNNYPSFDNALSSIKSNGLGVAFHKYYAFKCLEKDDTELLGIHHMNNPNPFALFDTLENKVELGVKTKKNKAFFNVARKCGLFPSKYL